MISRSRSNFCWALVRLKGCIPFLRGWRSRGNRHGSRRGIRCIQPVHGFRGEEFFVFDSENGARYIWEENGVKEDYKSAIHVVEMQCRLGRRA